MPVKNKLRECRERLGWSQEQLAAKSGVGRSTISEAEAGTHTPTLAAALKLSRALDVPMEEIFILVY